MTMKISELIDFANQRWPLDAKASWDNPGLAIGSPRSTVNKVLLSVDVTPQIIKEAATSGAGLVFSHHPLLLRGVDSVNAETLKGNVVTSAITNGIAVFSAHTNADFASGGVSEVLAKTIGIAPTGPLTSEGDGVVGNLTPQRLVDFARLVAKLLPSVAQGVLVQGDPERIISKVGLVAGAGDSYLDAARAAGVDLYITSDLRHHPASDFRDNAIVSGGPALMNIAHFSAEWPWLEQAAAELRKAFPEVEFVVSELNTDPWDFAVMQ
ncbi:GTP cyclohydrolase 1 type 2 [Aquiluna sp. KACHI24]|nr:GTP cyclohydrolase 1 type 2 [Aquiluna sp. KACHI24]